MSIRSLYEAAEVAKRGWRSRPDGYECMEEAWDAYKAQGETLRQALPFATRVPYVAPRR